MDVALTIGIMFVVFGFIVYMREEGPKTLLDDIHPVAYIIIGAIVLINCGIHVLIE